MAGIISFIRSSILLVGFCDNADPTMTSGTDSCHDFNNTCRVSRQDLASGGGSGALCRKMSTNASKLRFLRSCTLWEGDRRMMVPM
jgi:hypothetical protein